MESKEQAIQSPSIKYMNINIDGTEIFYREAGDKKKPKLLLLHGYPSSSHMFRNVIAVLSEQFHIIAPDLPGFGFSAVPPKEVFGYTFENFSKIIGRLLSELKIEKTSFYLFDYGAPVIMRLIASNPSCAEMLIFQNCTIHLQGLGSGLRDTMALFRDKTRANLEKLLKLVQPEYLKWEYMNGVKDPSRIAPESYTMDQLLMERKDLKEIHLAIKEDYRSNISLYKNWQQTLIALQPPTLIVWGERDQVFTEQAALALHEDITDSKLIFYPTGHFALEEFGMEIAQEIIRYYQSNYK